MESEISDCLQNHDSEHLSQINFDLVSDTDPSVPNYSSELSSFLSKDCTSTTTNVCFGQNTMDVTNERPSSVSPGIQCVRRVLVENAKNYLPSPPKYVTKIDNMRKSCSAFENSIPMPVSPEFTCSFDQRMSMPLHLQTASDISSDTSLGFDVSSIAHVSANHSKAFVQSRDNVPRKSVFRTREINETAPSDETFNIESSLCKTVSPRHSVNSSSTNKESKSRKSMFFKMAETIESDDIFENISESITPSENSSIAENSKLNISNKKCQIALQPRKSAFHKNYNTSEETNIDMTFTKTLDATNSSDISSFEKSKSFVQKRPKKSIFTKQAESESYRSSMECTNQKTTSETNSDATDISDLEKTKSSQEYAKPRKTLLRSQTPNTSASVSDLSDLEKTKSYEKEQLSVSNILEDVMEECEQDNPCNSVNDEKEQSSVRNNILEDAMEECEQDNPCNSVNDGKEQSSVGNINALDNTLNVVQANEEKEQSLASNQKTREETLNAEDTMEDSERYEKSNSTCINAHHETFELTSCTNLTLARTNLSREIGRISDIPSINHQSNLIISAVDNNDGIYSDSSLGFDASSIAHVPEFDSKVFEPTKYVPKKSVFNPKPTPSDETFNIESSFSKNLSQQTKYKSDENDVMKSRKSMFSIAIARVSEDSEVNNESFISSENISIYEIATDTNVNSKKKVHPRKSAFHKNYNISEESDMDMTFTNSQESTKMNALSKILKPKIFQNNKSVQSFEVEINSLADDSKIDSSNISTFEKSKSFLQKTSKKSIFTRQECTTQKTKNETNFDATDISDLEESMSSREYAKPRKTILCSQFPNTSPSVSDISDLENTKSYGGEKEQHSVCNNNTLEDTLTEDAMEERERENSSDSVFRNAQHQIHETFELTPCPTLAKTKLSMNSEEIPQITLIGEQCNSNLLDNEVKNNTFTLLKHDTFLINSANNSRENLAVGKNNETFTASNPVSSLDILPIISSGIYNTDNIPDCYQESRIPHISEESLLTTEEIISTSPKSTRSCQTGMLTLSAVMPGNNTVTCANNIINSPQVPEENMKKISQARVSASPMLSASNMEIPTICHLNFETNVNTPKLSNENTNTSRRNSRLSLGMIFECNVNTPVRESKQLKINSASESDERVLISLNSDRTSSLSILPISSDSHNIEEMPDPNHRATQNNHQKTNSQTTTTSVVKKSKEDLSILMSDAMEKTTETEVMEGVMQSLSLNMGKSDEKYSSLAKKIPEIINSPYKTVYGNAGSFSKAGRRSSVMSGIRKLPSRRSSLRSFNVRSLPSHMTALSRSPSSNVSEDFNSTSGSAYMTHSQHVCETISMNSSDPSSKTNNGVSQIQGTSSGHTATISDMSSNSTQQVKRRKKRNLLSTSTLMENLTQDTMNTSVKSKDVTFSARKTNLTQRTNKLLNELSVKSSKERTLDFSTDSGTTGPSDHSDKLETFKQPLLPRRLSKVSFNESRAQSDGISLETPDLRDSEDLSDLTSSQFFKHINKNSTKISQFGTSTARKVKSINQTSTDGVSSRSSKTSSLSNIDISSIARDKTQSSMTSMKSKSSLQEVSSIKSVSVSVDAAVTEGTQRRSSVGLGYETMDYAELSRATHPEDSILRKVLITHDTSSVSESAPTTSQAKRCARRKPNENVLEIVLDNGEIYKPKKLFKHKNTPWINNRLYKYLQSKLEPKYKLKTRLVSEYFTKLLYEKTYEIYSNGDIVYAHTPENKAVLEYLKNKMVGLGLIDCDWDFFDFLKDYLPPPYGKCACAVLSTRRLFDKLEYVESEEEE